MPAMVALPRLIKHAAAAVSRAVVHQAVGEDDAAAFVANPDCAAVSAVVIDKLALDACCGTADRDAEGASAKLRPVVFHSDISDLGVPLQQAHRSAVHAQAMAVDQVQLAERQATAVFDIEYGMGAVAVDDAPEAIVVGGDSDS